MAVSPSADAPLAERLRFVRPLGPRGGSTWVAIETLADGKTRLVAVERVPRGGELRDGEVADWIRDVRRLATLEHPSLARVRDVVIGSDEILVTNDFLDGVRWSELSTREPRPPLETSLRVLVDVLSGLGAMHNLRDAKREPLKLVHADLTPDHVIVGTEGIARITLPRRGRAGGLQEERTGSAYLAPEVLLGDESADARADVYSVGVMLWEALAARPLFPGLQPSAIVTQLLSGRVPKATLAQSSAWAEPLCEVAHRTISADPGRRFVSAAALAAEIRRVAGVKLAPSVRVAASVRGTFGDRIKARRGEIERGEASHAGEEDSAIEIDIRVSVPAPEPRPTATTRPPPGDAASAPAAPIAPPAPVPSGAQIEVRVEPIVEPMAAPPRIVERVVTPEPLRRAPPPLRPRLPTLTGVAPPVAPAGEVRGRGAPVVVPSSRPPPPAHAMPTETEAGVPLPPAAAAAAVAVVAPLHLPPAAHVPIDLVEQIAVEARLEPLMTAPQASPVPAMPPMVTPLEPPAQIDPEPVRRKRATVLVPIALVAVAVMGVVAWLAARSSSPTAATPTPSVSAASTESVGPTSTAPKALPRGAASLAPAPPAPAGAIPPSSGSAPATAPPAPDTATAPNDTAPAATAPPPATAAPAPAPLPVAPPRAPTRPKYEPEGI